MLWKWIKMIVSVVLCCCVWIDLAPVFYDWYFASEKTKWFRDLCVFLDGRTWIDLPLCLAIIYLCVRGFARLFKDEDIRPYRIGVIALLLIFINIKCSAIYSCIIGEFRFNHFFNILLVSCLLISLYPIVRYIINKCSKAADSEDGSANGGFSVDDEHDADLPRNVVIYGETLANQLLATMRRNKHSIAVGITGEWGSGKTTFLNLLNKCLDGKAEIVRFNPWMCQTPEQVTRDFFATLRHQLSRNHSSLSKPISHYAKYLDKVRISFLGNVWFEMANPAKAPSLLALKDELSLKFEALDKPVVVFIDDLDRLESKEVFEVLRLIRNTGDINNTIYVAAFDKEYVTSVLKGIGCNTPSAYLEKIFPIELHLPKPESYQIWEVFKEELRAQDTTGRRFAETLVNSFSSSDSDLILKILTNYRKVKRFCRLLMLNVNFIAQYYRADLKFLDLFWIELLQFYDSLTYDILARDASKLLYYDSSSRRYILREGIAAGVISKEESHHYKDDRIWQPLTPDILQKLFGKYITTAPKSICFPENYMKFFALGLSAQRLSVNEYRHLTDGKHDYRQVIDNWIEQRKYISSIEYNLLQTKTRSLSESELSSYLNGALYFGLKKQSWQNRGLGFLNSILEIGNFKDDKTAHDIVERWIQAQIVKSDNLLPLSGILNSLYATKEYEGDNPGKYTMRLKVLSNKEIETMLATIARKYLEKHKSEVSPSDIFDKDKDLFKLFDNCCVEAECVEMEGLSHYIQTGFDGVIQFFKVSDSKPAVEEYERRMSELSRRYEPDPDSFEDPNDYYQCQEYEYERYVNMMSSHFGSGYEKNLVEFKSECFRPSSVPTPEPEAKTPKQSSQKAKTAGSRYGKNRGKRKGKRK